MMKEDDVLKAMGVPVVGTPEAYKLFFDTKLRKLEDLLKAIAGLEDVHRGFTLARYTTGLCKVVNLTKTLDTSTPVYGPIFFDFLQKVDELQIQHLGLITRLGVFGATERLQVGLAIGKGGFGFKSVVRHRDAAFISGTAAASGMLGKQLGLGDVHFRDPRLDLALLRYNADVGRDERSPDRLLIADLLVTNPPPASTPSLPPSMPQTSRSTSGVVLTLKRLLACVPSLILMLVPSCRTCLTLSDACFSSMRSSPPTSVSASAASLTQVSLVPSVLMVCLTRRASTSLPVASSPSTACAGMMRW